MKKIFCFLSHLLILTSFFAGPAQSATLQWSSKVGISFIQSEKSGHAIYTTSSTGLNCQDSGRTIRLGFHAQFPNDSPEFSESTIGRILSQILVAMSTGKQMEFRIETGTGLCFIHEVKLYN